MQSDVPPDSPTVRKCGASSEGPRREVVESSRHEVMSLLYRPRISKRYFYIVLLVGSLLLLWGLSWGLGRVAPAAAPLPWVAAIVALAWGVIYERRWVEITHHAICLEGLPPTLDGFRIVQLSDIHWDVRIQTDWLDGVFKRVHGLDPDLVVLTGDLVTHEPEYIEPCARYLGYLRARRGVFAVLGNHDHWAGGRKMSEALTREGIQVLSNRNVRVDAPNGSAGFWLAGVDDPHMRKARLDEALAGIPEDGLPRLLLAHSPDIMEEAAGRVDLVLTGHTHGGQVQFPGVGVLICSTRRRSSKPFAVGLRRAGRTLCFTNRGLGTVLIPIRFHCRPEVAAFTLRPAQERTQGA